MSRVDTAWEKFLANARRRQLPELPLGEYAFTDIAWPNANPLELAKALTDPRRSYPGHMEVLFAAYTAWVVDPSDRSFQRTAVRHAIRRVMARFERRDAEQPIIASFLQKTLTGLNFIENIYLPAGGAIGLSKTTTTANLRRRLADLELKVAPVVSLARQFHHIVPELSTGLYHKPSINKLAAGAGKGGTSVANLWLAYRRTIALRYAATSIPVGGGTLLQAIVGGQASARRHQQYMTEWLGRARWYAAHVLFACADPIYARENLAVLPDVQPIAFDVPEPKAWELAEVTKRLKVA